MDYVQKQIMVPSIKINLIYLPLDDTEHYPLIMTLFSLRLVEVVLIFTVFRTLAFNTALINLY